jgi:leader peptidase (prepilin peptidase) / N-methyltransferase
MLPLFAEFIALSAVLLAIAVIDLRSFRIPDLLSLPLIAAGLALSHLRDLALADHLIGAALGFGLFAAIGSGYHRRHGIDALGLGDAKLFAAAGAWLGWQALPIVLLIAALGGLGFALLTRQTSRRCAIAFGPWLALGLWCVWVAQNLLRLSP